MPKVSVQKNAAKDEVKAMIVRRVTPIIENFLKNDSLLDELDQTEMVSLLSTLLTEKFSLAELKAMTDESLTRKIRRVLGVEVMFGLIRDFTPEQMAEFDVAVSGQNWR
ncbi:MAG: hypothetical protein AB4426_18645 [Xenococcaceae cyanobacterium]